jgi:hypothetical protein
MMFVMIGEAGHESPANTLCKACGLCCTGHLFIWTKLRSSELDSIEALGVKVFRSVPSQRGFNQPCPLWQGQCTIYATPSYPRFCHTYKCKLLKRVLDEITTLPEALSLVGQAKAIIQGLETALPDSPSPNFRERLAVVLEGTAAPSGEDRDLRQKAKVLLAAYERVFGVDDLIGDPDDLPLLAENERVVLKQKTMIWSEHESTP